MHTFNHVLQFVSNIILDDEAQDDKVFKLDTGVYANVFIDSDGHLQVCMYDDEELEEEADGGGVCIMEDDEDSEEYEGERIRKILETGTPREILTLIEEKALFIWELMGRGVCDFTSYCPAELVTKRVDRVSYEEVIDSINDKSFVSTRINEPYCQVDILHDSVESVYRIRETGEDGREAVYTLSNPDGVVKRVSDFKKTKAVISF